MKNIRNLVLPVLAFMVLALASCSNEDVTVQYSAESLKNTELMTVLKSKGYQFDKDGKLELNDLANNTTSLDLSGTKLKDLSGLDILPNLKDVKLSDNGYGPTFDFAKLPAQITGVDLTGNDIHTYKNLVDVKVAENDEETITNLHNLTKLYLPAEAKYNIKDIVRYYRKNKDDITSGKIDMKMADEKGNLQKYNTIRSVTNEKVFDVIKTDFSSIMTSDGKQIDLSKRLSDKDKLNGFGIYEEEGSGSTSTAPDYFDGIQYIVENPYWEGTSFTIQPVAKGNSIPYVEIGSSVQTFILHNTNMSKGVCYDHAQSLTQIWFDDVRGANEIDLSHSKLFGQRDPKLEEASYDGSGVMLNNCPDLVSIKFPERNDLCAATLELIDLSKLSTIDLTPFKQVTMLCFSTLAPDCKIVYPGLRSFPGDGTSFGCNEEVFKKQETKEFIKKYYVNSAAQKIRVQLSPLGTILKEGVKNLIQWTEPKYLDMLNN